MPGRDPIPGPGPASDADSATPVLDAQLSLGGGRFIDLPVRFVYRGEAPFSVVMEFPGSDPAVGTWEFSRDLLWKGLRRPAGMGDVRISPPCRCHGRGRLRITLRGDDGTAAIDVPVEPVRSWLHEQSFALVPRGVESELIDWDAELIRLVG
ncbi:SsgA family sporulation/cell division regulator [Kitasatospora brasiliensis]|uniref:SsgA family sporulation/cell division regulator n=1 Tax=Kitasatospora brasiliensis TaxID=3058040 RepID=UPI00292FBE2B|nr:SsgA family sporulation/cell division regulator [Kitasatospora sp. K002]